MTTADFAVKLYIEESHWNAWKIFKKESGLVSFRQYLKQEIET